MSDKNIILTHNEDYKIFDKLGREAQRKRGPVGWVKAYMHKNPNQLGEPFYDGPNLILAKGREFVAQKIFQVNVKEDATSRPDYRNHKVSHFAVGSGGASVAGSVVTLSGPEIGDTALYEVISLGNAAYLDEPSAYTASGESPLVHTYTDAVKPITTDGEIYLEPVSYPSSPDYYTKVKCTCVIPAGEPTMIDPAASVEISEAGLYFVDESLADGDSNKVHTFAHICFAPKWKEKESQLTIFWYILA